MKRILRIAAAMVVLFVGANILAARDQAADSQLLASDTNGAECYYVNGQWVCIK